MDARTLLRRIGAALGLAIFALLVFRLQPHWPALRRAWQGLAWQDLALALAGVLAAQAAFAAAWHRLLHAPGERGNYLGDAARWSVSLAGKYIPGKVWQPLARYGLYHGADRGARVAPAYVRELLLTLSAASAWVALARPAARASATPSPMALGFGLGALVLALLAAPGVGVRALSLLARWLPAAWQLGDARWRVVAVAWAWQALGYALLGLGLFALGRGLGWFDDSQAGLAIAAMCFGGLAGIAALFVPAGIGVREAAMAWFLAPVIGAAPALMVAVLARAWISLGEALVVAAGLAWLQRHPSAAPTS